MLVKERSMMLCLLLESSDSLLYLYGVFTRRKPCWLADSMYGCERRSSLQERRWRASAEWEGRLKSQKTSWGLSDGMKIVEGLSEWVVLSSFLLQIMVIVRVE